MIEQVEKLEDVTMPSHGQTVWCSSEDKCYRYDAIEGWIGRASCRERV